MVSREQWLRWCRIAELVSAIAFGAALVYFLRRGDGSIERWQLAFVTLPAAVFFAVNVPLIYVSWFRKPMRPAARWLFTGIYWLFAVGFTAMAVALLLLPWRWR